jgi:two-component system, NarL family, nitrate/nitrite response regulator NarL
MSAEVDARLVQQARDAGATGFMPKAAATGEVLAAVAAALAGQQAFAAVPYVMPAAARNPVRADEQDEGQADARQVPPASAWVASEAAPALTRRQIDILHYLGRGTPNKAIARQMGMSETDVRAEVSWLTDWLGASSREEAHAQALAKGLLTT